MTISQAIKPELQDEAFSAILQTCVLMLEEAVKAGSTDLRHTDAIHLFKKIIYHCATARRLLDPTVVPNIPNADFIDFQSIAIIARCAAESVMIFQHIFHCPAVNADEQRFRHVTWRLNGFLDRDKMVENRQHFQAEIAENQKKIDDCKTTIQSTAFFGKLNTSAQNKALAGEWRKALASGQGTNGILTWSDMASASGLSDAFAKKLYKFQSQFVHSTSISVFQIGEAMGPQQEQSARLTLMHVAALMAFMARKFAEYFPPANAFIAQDQPVSTVVDFYYHIATN